jgi:hypothetical protein
MRKKLLLLSGVGILFLTLYFLNPFKSAGVEEKLEEDEGSRLDLYEQEFEQLKDPALGRVPNNRLLEANEYTNELKRKASANRVAGLNWQERGPVYDFVGPSNGNSRAGNGYTAGIVQTALVDLASDPTGNIVFAGSSSGGLWRCTNFLSFTPPNWQPVNDFMANLAVASICQNPASPNIMYMATGDGNTRDVRGYGVWKSTNSGLNWTLLLNTTTYNTAFKILCDNAGNVYLATGGGGLKRSNNGGTTWTTISPTGLTASNASYVTDIEISSTGRLHAAFGYFGTKAQHAYTDNPATATSALGWNFSTGIRQSTVSCTRIEMATQGDILYAVTANSSHNIDSCYKSTDGGTTWTLKNTTAAYTPQLGTGQTWFAVTLAINPDDPNQFIVGGLDAYKSIDEGQSVQRITYWVGNTAPYVHADHHYMQWYKIGNESRILIGCDGGITQSYDGGVSWIDRNQNLGIKQFYSCAISPTAGTNFLFAGSQDNGCHQLTNPGLSWSTETTGGDGAYVHINQQDPQIQFGSYVYNNYRRSINGGSSWTPVNFGNTGYFINPFDYDDTKNSMYSSNASTNNPNNQFRRWDNANTTGNTGSTVFTIDELVRNFSNSNASAFKVSPYTTDRIFIGGSTGKLLRLNNASTVTSSTDITTNITDVTGSAFPTGYINCITTGTSDNTLVAVFTNYGINNVWYSNDGGTSWTPVDGTIGAGGLPDMPVWWAVFEPGSNTKLILGTEAGVYSTEAVNGANTVWAADPSFPNVRTRMLKVRASDNTIIAATYGRGLWTATIGGGCALPTISSQPASQVICSGANATFTVTATGIALTYQWRKGGVNINSATSATFTITGAAASDAGTYDVIVTNSCGNTTSNPVTLTLNAPATINTQPISQTGCASSTVTFGVSASGSALTYQWRKGGVNINGATSSNLVLPNLSAADAASYDVVISSCGGSITSSAATLTVNAATTITSQQSTQSVCAGANASFSVVAVGTGALTYQWKKDGINIPNATSDNYAIASAVLADAGSYTVVVTGSCGSVTSSPAALAVNTGGGCVTAVPNIDPDVTTMLLMPNVVIQNTVLRISVRRAMKIDWSVIDAQGRVMMKFTQKVTAGQNDMPLQLGRLAAGSYYLNGTTEKGRLGLMKFQKL